MHHRCQHKHHYLSFTGRILLLLNRQVIIPFIMSCALTVLFCCLGWCSPCSILTVVYDKKHCHCIKVHQLVVILCIQYHQSLTNFCPQTVLKKRFTIGVCACVHACTRERERENGNMEYMGKRVGVFTHQTVILICIFFLSGPSQIYIDAFQTKRTGQDPWLRGAFFL